MRPHLPQKRKEDSISKIPFRVSQTAICVDFAPYLRAKIRNVHMQIISAENEVIWRCLRITGK